ncbi:MAG: sigma-70 family RNA polymerase sigma factor, partial [Candidatus Hydrogenedentes bacterium]|nr:sigma-70 family RNA polymerase sigma factor [Candidatus Hydrogenedentota bacterium]
MSIALDTTVLCERPEEEGQQPHTRVSADSKDIELVARAKTGNIDAFELLVKRYRNEVFALSYHFVKNREQAWDMSQEVFIKAHNALARFRGDASFKTWLMRITANQCKDYLKKRRIETVSFDDSRYAA